ncbi:hypothetical protein B0919_15820 [Hymenobacter sp. CRA2]|nr:hypothetical protein B0919_15820 [Hymenobacter sp. CRA2]
MVVQLYQDSASRRVQLRLQVAQVPLYARVFDSVAYQAPALTAHLPGGTRLALREEPNFLTGAVWLNDTLRAELVAVRRGAADAPTFAVVQPPADGAPPPLRYWLPLDTLSQQPAVLLCPDAAATGAAYGWAAWLADQGTVVALLALPPAAPDSIVAQNVTAAMQHLRHNDRARIDSTRVGIWAMGTAARGAARAMTAARAPGAAFLWLQGAAFEMADRTWLRQLGRRRVPVLGLYGGRDTTINVAESSQLLRSAVGRRGQSSISVYAGANAQLLMPADTAGQWPQLPPNLLPILQKWVGVTR